MPTKVTGRTRLLVAGLCLAAFAPACSAMPPPVEQSAPLSELLRGRPSPDATDGRTGRCDVPRRATPSETRPQYDMSIEISTESRSVTGSSDVTFTADRRTRRLVFRLWPNGPRLAEEGASLEVEEASLAEGAATVTSPDPTTLIYELADPLEAGDSATAVMRWRLQVPDGLLDRISQNGSSVRLGSFFPILAWEEAKGWVTDPPTTSLAESSTTPTADFDVRITVPEGLGVLASGEEVAPGRWRAEAVRDFAVAAGDFSVVRRVVDAPRPVGVTVGVARGLRSSPDDFARHIARALRDLSDRYGAYPWSTFSMAIMPDLDSAGIEYPTMIFQGDESLDHATTHEVAHSWFYGLVGNNQARDPWLDEGVTSWAQGRSDGIMGFFRSYEIDAGVRGRMGEAMPFWDARRKSYYGGVYVQGVRALDALGDARGVDCALKRYVAANAYGVGTTEELLEALETDFPRARRVLRRFGARV